MKILTIVGARPQFVKASVVSNEIARRAEVEEVLVHTGQHFSHDMSQVFFDEMKINPPKYNFDIHSLGHGAMTGRMLESVEEVLLEEEPDVVLVYGDTNSTLAGGLAAAKLHIPVAHVEAGLRSHNRKMPEELNRVLVDHLSEYLLCPTQVAVDNLASEGIGRGGDPRVEVVGDVMFDASLHYRQRAKTVPLGCEGEFALMTLHRAENTDSPERLSSIVSGIKLLSNDLPIIVPLHPRTKKALITQGLSLEAPNVTVLDPVSYLEMMYLLDHCSLVITDSGGLQKEAYFFSKPCLTLRDETEWVELVDSGWNSLVGASSSGIVAAGKNADNTPGVQPEFYGDGNASRSIVDILLGS